MKKYLFFYTIIFAGYIRSAIAAPRNVIMAVSSSTVFPFTTIVAEHFGYTNGLPTPHIEATGSGGGIQLFCQGAEMNTPDMVSTSRVMTPAEIALCRHNSVGEIIEIKIGYDGILEKWALSFFAPENAERTTRSI